VGDAQQAYEKIRAGASAVQLYTAMVFGGLGLAADIARGLERLLERDGFETVAQAVGSGRGQWL
jgi:dihydroorotate dehydrogenase